MKVFILVENGGKCLGVYSTLKAAEADISECWEYIEEHEVKE